MRISTPKFLTVAFLALLLLGARAQETTVKILDAKTLEPCQYATVMLSSMANKYLDGGATDKNGLISFKIIEASRISVSSLGYASKNDTIYPDQNLIIMLTPDLLELETVVVTGQYKPQAVDRSIYRINVVDARTINQRGVNNLAEALSNETGIRLTVDPSLGTSIKMQGMGGENIKYLIDGVPIVGRVGGIIDLSQINMENIDHIEIVRGPMAVQYGTSAIAGVINIITKSNNYFRNQIKANSFTDTKGNYNIGLSGSVIRGNHSLSLAATRNLFQGVDIDLNVDTADVDGHDRYMEFKPKLVYNADLGYTYKNKDLQLRVKSQYMNTLLKNYSNYIEKVVLAYDADYHTTRSTNSISLSNKLSENLSYNIIAAYTYYGRETEYITSDLFLMTKEVTGTTATKFYNSMTRGSVTLASPEKNYSLMWGWDINHDSGSGDKLEDNATIGDYAVFISGQYNIRDKVIVQPGLRAIYNTIYGAPVVPSLNLQWKFSEAGNIRLSYARGFRAPSLKELYLDFKDSNHDLSGNRNLKAETTNSYNASFEYSLGNDLFTVKLEPELFYNDGKDAITLIVTDASSNSATNVNLGGRRTFGGEVNGSFSHNSGLLFGAGFSRIGETYDEEGEGDYLPVVYYNNLSVSGRYNLSWNKITFLANFKYYGETPVLAPVPEEDGGGYYRVYTDPFGDLELTITKNFWKNRATVVLGGKNLLNNYEGKTSGYEDYGQTDFQSAYLRPLNYGRSFFLKLNINLSF